ncbi:hypothetical protein DAI43_18300 [Achromobacter xylosoxidans]|uniref:hypothetical protein n=1 Tax=Achromobacter aegrifaciens TaxID=1287736 RepID=UPI000D4B64D7|nr:hypothetical protein [Achromobacter aegrifaciens]MDQ1762410.1 hypothetical protein [Achromobacter aegrifaciens]PTN50235.1 hypothetical protein DAI43_18300 [Achromobacter xylosoxidans]
MSKFITRWFYASVGHYDNVTTEGFFWNRKPKIEQVAEPKTANYEQFAEELAKIYNQFDEQGYDVVNVVPLAIGASEPVHAVMSGGGRNYLGDTGFSVTRGAIVVGKRRDAAS